MQIPKYAGSTIVFPAETFDPLATLQTIQEEECTALYGVPTMFTAELELLQDGIVEYKGFEHLRTGIAAGSSVPAELMKKLHKALNLTELSMYSTFPPAHHSFRLHVSPYHFILSYVELS